MSQTDKQEQQQQQQQQQQEQDKSMDKKEIAEEEREKMLNAENTKHSGAAPAPDLEADEHKPKRKIPIGGIKMPGFCRSKSKEPCKEEESAKPNENAAEENRAADNGQVAKEPKEKEGKSRGIIEAIRAPLSNVSNVFARKKKEADSELGTTRAAGLASVETLDDTVPEKNNAAAAAEDDTMDSVRLDAEAGGTVDDAPSKQLYVGIIAAIRRNLVPSLVTLFVCFVVILVLCLAFAGPRREPPSPINNGKVLTQASCGPIEGLVEEDALVFRGIPYAVPPVNERRWQHSEMMNKIENCWNGTFLAHNASDVCWQRNATYGAYGSEDCLYLDIYTPQVKQENPLPVVILIGADTLSGPSPGIMIPSGKLARVRETVYVRPNFRLDVFGFLAAEPLSRTAHPISSGNYGLSDLINVLNWVQLNIGFFGGNKDLVTLWGHRAGGTLVTALIGSRRASHLFQRAWISSGSAIFPTSELQESQKLNQPFLESIRCNDAACLRSKKAEDVMRAVPAAWYATNDGLPEAKDVNVKKHAWLVKDDIIIKQHIGDAFKQETLPVKIVMGTTAYSGRLPEAIKPNTTLTKEQVRSYISTSLFGRMGVAEDAMQKYFDNSTSKTPKEILHMMISDVRVVCPLMTVATMRSDIPFYISNFTNNVNLTVDSDVAAILGFFSNVTPEQKRHLQAIQQFFNHFIWNGEVRQANNTHRILTIDQDVNSQAGYENCKLWINRGIVPAYARVD